VIVFFLYLYFYFFIGLLDYELLFSNYPSKSKSGNNA
jgi:hypothetical protein